MLQVAFVFPGQGSQSVGMLRDLADKYAIIQQTFAEASAALSYDLWQLIQTDPDSKLNQTEFTQPAMLTAGVAVWRLWLELSALRPVVLAGHSLGEYTALVCAGALSLTQAVQLVAQRGRLMQAAVPEGTGAMAAVLGLEPTELIAICAKVGLGVVQAVNFNAPGQIVIAGHKAAVEQAIELAKAAGAKRALLLPLSVPSHCSLMLPAAEKLMLDLQQVTWGKSIYPVINNVDLATHNIAQNSSEKIGANIDANTGANISKHIVENSSEKIGLIDALARQLYNPVRWIETIQRIRQMGVTCLIECGPGKVLSGLNKRIEPELQCLALGDIASLDAAVAHANLSYCENGVE